jgi:hypothetical protein
MSLFGRALIFVVTIRALAGAPELHAQINQGQIDTFESGTTLSWTIGAGGFTGPAVQLGGPGGANDHFMQLNVNQLGGPPRFTLFNQSQWSGNYNAPQPAGSNPINVIEFDIANFSSTAIAARIALKTGGGFTPGYAFSGGPGTNGAFDIPADGLWHHVAFPINQATMTPISSPPPLPQLLDLVGELRILHSIAPALNGDPFTGRIGIDNIHAFFQPVPEPTAILGVAALALGVMPLRRRFMRPSDGRIAFGESEISPPISQTHGARSC